MLDIVFSEDDVMPPHFFKKGETVTKEIYLRVRMDVVKPWMKTVASGHIFFSRTVHRHTSHLIQNSLRRRWYILVQGILAKQPRFKFLELLRMERS